MRLEEMRPSDDDDDDDGPPLSSASLPLVPERVWGRGGSALALSLYHQPGRIYIQRGVECRIHSKLKIVK